MIGIHFSFITKIPGDTLLTKMPAERELPSTKQILTETRRLVPLLMYPLKLMVSTKNYMTTINHLAISNFTQVDRALYIIETKDFSISIPTFNVFQRKFDWLTILSKQKLRHFCGQTTGLNILPK